MRGADHAAVEVAAFLLTAPDARLSKTDAGASTEVLAFENASVFVVDAAPETIGLDRAEAAIAGEIAALARDGPGEEEMVRARNNLESAEMAKLESQWGTASAIHDAAAYLGSADRVSAWVSRHSRVTAADVRRAAREWLDTANRATVVVRRETSSAVGQPSLDGPPPAFRSEPAFEPPEVQEARLPNGLRILVVERRALPRVSVRIRWKVTAMHVPPGKEPLGLLTAAALKRGTTARDSASIDRELSSLAASFEASGDLESLGLGFDVLSRNLPPALHLMADMVLHPSSGPKRFADDKREWLDAAESAGSQPDDFHPAAAAIGFGPKHPLGRRPTGTVASLRSIVAEDAVAFYRRYVRPDNAALTFVGGITLGEAERLARAAFGSWSGAAEPAAAAPPLQPESGRAFLIERPGAAQTLVVAILPGVSREHPDFLPLTVADKALGGMFSARMMQRIRQDLGIAYFANSQLWPVAAHGLWLAYSPVQADKAAVALAEFDAILRGIGGGRPVAAEELALAKQALIREYPSAFEESPSPADLISRQWARGEPMEAPRTWPRRIGAVTLEEVNAAARRYARIDRRVFLLTGDRRVAEEAARAHGLGGIALLYPDGSR